MTVTPPLDRKHAPCRPVPVPSLHSSASLLSNQETQSMFDMKRARCELCKWRHSERVTMASRHCTNSHPQQPADRHPVLVTSLPQALRPSVATLKVNSIHAHVRTVRKCERSKTSYTLCRRSCHTPRTFRRQPSEGNLSVHGAGGSGMKGRKSFVAQHWE